MNAANDVEVERLKKTDVKDLVFFTEPSSQSCLSGCGPNPFGPRSGDAGRRSRRWLANVADELRTRLTVLRGVIAALPFDGAQRRVVVAAITTA